MRDLVGQGYLFGLMCAIETTALRFRLTGSSPGSLTWKRETKQQIELSVGADTPMMPSQKPFFDGGCARQGPNMNSRTLDLSHTVAGLDC